MRGTTFTACVVALLVLASATRFSPDNPHKTGFANVKYSYLIAKARAALLLPQEPELSADKDKLRTLWIGTLVDVLYNPANMPARLGITVSSFASLVYVRIFKVGNNAIRCNMGCCRSSSDTARETAHDVQHGRLEQEGTSMSEHLKMLQAENYTFFTAVRDPAEKFISGFIEMCYRVPSDEYCIKYKVSRTPVHDFLTDILTGRPAWASKPILSSNRFLSGVDMRHIASISAEVRPWPLQILELQFITHSWTDLYVKTLGVVPVKYSPGQCGHPTSGRQDPFRRNVIQEMATNSSSATSLCWLLYEDYVNFGYPFPETCKMP